jgi:2-oxoglutarate ferredoxin oxidoreductase subunit beta
MNKDIFNMGNIDIAWCPGCGNFGILNVLKEVLAELGIGYRSGSEDPSLF